MRRSDICLNSAYSVRNVITENFKEVEIVSNTSQDIIDLRILVVCKKTTKKKYDDGIVCSNCLARVS